VSYLSGAWGGLSQQPACPVRVWSSRCRCWGRWSAVVSRWTGRCTH